MTRPEHSDEPALPVHAQPVLPVQGQPALVPSGPRGGVEASALPEHGFGPTAISWWGTVAFMIIEGTSLVICLLTYLYLRRNFEAYPPPGFARPALLIPTLNMVLMLATLPLARRLEHAARAYDASGVLRGFVILLAFELVILTLRAFELAHLNVRWDSNAYGSAVWFAVGFHTLLLLINFAESAGIALIYARGKQEKKHYTDTSDDVVYWYFVVAAWLVVYAVIFLGPFVL